MPPAQNDPQNNFQNQSDDLSINSALKQIHSASMSLLARNGLKLHAPWAVDLFRERSIKTIGDIVFPTEDFILETISTAPRKFRLLARSDQPDSPSGDEAFQGAVIDGQRSYLASAYGCPAITEEMGASGQLP
jgi:trimethylamine:corrinoid methyltransferase-like protein